MNHPCYLRHGLQERKHGENIGANTMMVGENIKMTKNVLHVEYSVFRNI